MRERYLGAFDAIRIDCLNGDKYKTGKVAPDGSPDPSIFSTKGDPVGIQVGTAIATLVRRPDHAPAREVSFRHLWGQAKPETLLESSDAESNVLYESIEPLLPLGLPFVQTAISRYLGMTLGYCENGVARVRLPFRAEFEDGHGVIHGGLIGLLADTAGNFAVGSVSSGSTVKTVEFKLSLLAGVQGDLLAIGELVRKGRTLAACRLEVVESSGRVVAIGLATYALQAV